MMREPNPDHYDVIEALDQIIVATAEDDLDEAERWRRIARRRLLHCRVLYGLVIAFGAAGWLVGRWWR